MLNHNGDHNLLIVSDLHVAEGLRAEAGEANHGLDAYLYDGAFARFLRYHEQTRRDAARRGQELRRARAAGQPVDEDAAEEAAQRARPWRLILAGDVFDFWDVVRVPGDAATLKTALDDLIEALGAQSPAGEWLRELKTRLSAVQAGLQVADWDYDTLRARLDGLHLDDGRQRHAVEDLTWWTEVLVLKGARLPRRERRHGLGTAWQEVVWKLNLIYGGHAELFGALAWFIACGNEAILLKGNHDIELYWPQVHSGHLPHLLADAYRELRAGQALGPSFDDYPPQLWVDVEGRPLPDDAAFRQLLPAYPPDDQGLAGGRRLVFEEWYYCEPDLVYVEHGNQYEPADASVEFLEPTMPADPDRIELPWGAFMVRYFYNKIVTVHPFAVNVKPEQKIIHWMIRHDLFRLLGIVLAEITDIVRGLVRAVKQGFRGTWLWGDHSILGLLPLLLYDLIQIRIWLARRGRQRQQETGSQQDIGDQDAAPWSEFESLSARTLLHLGALGAVVCLILLAGGGLFAWPWTAGLAVPLLAFTALTLTGTAWSVFLEGDQGQHGLGETLLQVGAVSTIAAAIAGLTIGPVLGWSPVALILVVVTSLAATAAGAGLIDRTGSGESGLFRRTWQARSLRSGASLFLELGLLATLAGAYYQFGPPDARPAGAWLATGLALFVAAWATYRIYKRYVNRQQPARRSVEMIDKLGRGIRIVSTVLVVLLALGLVIPPLAWLLGFAIPGLFPGDTFSQATSVAQFAGELYENMTDAPLPEFPWPFVLVIALASVVVVETITQWLLQRWRNAQLKPRTARRHARPEPEPELRMMPLALPHQEDEIRELAREEQRHWVGSLLGILIMLLPFVSLVLLAVAIVGGLAGLLELAGPLQQAVEPLKALGLSALFGLGYWLLRQISAASQRHDPQSGFGDLFYRVASRIAGILAETEGWDGPPGMGQPRYFVFGHDHWADRKALPQIRQADRGAGRQWYVNAGTWLRGYVEEQRHQEVNENHSTFIQIIPGLDEDEAPRVLRWNDGAGQPEQIVRRREPQSTSQMLWSRWESGWLTALAWALLLALTLWRAPSDWLQEPWPLLWIPGLWLAAWLLGQALEWLADLVHIYLLGHPRHQPAPDPANVTDVHCHVGLLGDEHPDWGQMLPEYQQLPVFQGLLIYGGLDPDQVSDASLRASTEEAISSTHLGHVVCLALDHVYDDQGKPQPDRSNVWVDNEYILDLQRTLGDKVLLGASVHPYDPNFRERVLHYVDEGAVLLKWLPSAQQIDLADPRVRDALQFLATARHGQPLPLLLHVGPEYAIPSTDPRTTSYDYLTWTWRDALKDRFRAPGERLYPVRGKEIQANLEAGLDAGAVIIFAHCGLPYFTPRWLGRFFEHSELRTVRRYLEKYPADGPNGHGRCYADVSALVTPFRRSYFSAIRRLPPNSLLFGSDFPTPVFELSAGLGEARRDLEAALEGEPERALVPQDNLLDVNYRELQHYFPGHPMFSNFDDLLQKGQ